MQEQSPKYKWNRLPGYKDKITEQLIKRVRAQHAGKLVCEYCGKEVEVQVVGASTVPKPVRFVVDHFIPIGLKGKIDDLLNLRAACVPCNTAKGHKPGITLADGSPSWLGR